MDNKKKRKASKKSQTRINEKEINHVEHDHLLTWLVDNLDSVVDELWGVDDAWQNEQENKAIEDYRVFMGAVIKKLEDLPNLKDLSLSSETVALCKHKAKEAREYLASWVPPPPLAPSFACLAHVESWHLEDELYQESLDRYRNEKKEFAGYIDLRAFVNTPSTLKLELESTIDYIGPKIFFWDNNNIASWVEELEFVQPTWKKYFDTNEVLFDVRFELSTIGELVQELKNLRHLYLNEAPAICLVCPKISDDWVGVLIHEGFWIYTTEDDTC